MTRYSSMDALRRTLSPDVAVVDDTAPRPPIALTADTAAALGVTGDLGGAAPLEQAQAGVNTSALAVKFEHLWESWDGPTLEREYKFSPARRWRADYAVPSAKVLIELEGGLYSNGRHSRAGGYLADIEKYNAAAMLGYTVFRLGTGQVDHQHVGEIADWVQRRTVVTTALWTVGFLMAWEKEHENMPCGHSFEHMGRADVDHRYCKVCNGTVQP